jgi:hypothetical protein
MLPFTPVYVILGIAEEEKYLTTCSDGRMMKYPPGVIISGLAGNPKPMPSPLPNWTVPAGNGSPNMP